MKSCLLAITFFSIQASSACLYEDDEIGAGASRTSAETVMLNEDGKSILPGSQVDNSVAGLATPECINSWSLTASMNWGVVADWDFHLQTPSAHIYYGNRSADGFTLDHDAYPNCGGSAPPPEVITGNGQCGIYKLYSNLYSTCNGSPPIAFSATVTASKPIIINNTTALGVGQTFQPMNGVPFKVDPGRFEITGSIPLPQPDNDPAGEFASGSVQNAAQCNPHRANAFRGLGATAAFAFFSTGSIEASDLLNHFLAGTGTPMDYPDGSALSQAVKADSQFVALDNKVQAAAAVQFNAGLLAAEVTPDLKTLNFSTSSTALRLQTAFGGTQGLDVQGSVSIQGGSYTGTITYTIRDIYGFYDNNKFLYVGKAMHYLQGICGAPDFPGGARWFADSVTVTVPFSQPAP